MDSKSELPVQRMLMARSPPMNNWPLHVLKRNPNTPSIPPPSRAPLWIWPLWIYSPAQVHVVIHLSSMNGQELVRLTWIKETCRGSIILAVTTGAGLVILLRAKLGVPELSPETVLKRELSMESMAIIILPSPPQMLHFYTLAALLAKETGQADQSPTAWFACAAHL